MNSRRKSYGNVASSGTGEEGGTGWKMGIFSPNLAPGVRLQVRSLFFFLDNWGIWATAAAAGKPRRFLVLGTTSSSISSSISSSSSSLVSSMMTCRTSPSSLIFCTSGSLSRKSLYSISACCLRTPLPKWLTSIPAPTVSSSSSLSSSERVSSASGMRMTRLLLVLAMVLLSNSMAVIWSQLRPTFLKIKKIFL